MFIWSLFWPDYGQRIRAMELCLEDTFRDAELLTLVPKE
jgi:hypothetical protein